MKRVFHSKDGIEERELTKEEMAKLAEWGDGEVRKEILKEDLLLAGTLNAEVAAIKKYLGVA